MAGATGNSIGKVLIATQHTAIVDYNGVGIGTKMLKSLN